METVTTPEIRNFTLRGNCFNQRSHLSGMSFSSYAI